MAFALIKSRLFLIVWQPWLAIRAVTGCRLIVSEAPSVVDGGHGFTIGPQLQVKLYRLQYLYSCLYAGLESSCFSLFSLAVSCKYNISLLGRLRFSTTAGQKA